MGADASKELISELSAVDTFTESEADQIMDLFDTDRDEVLSPEEMMKFIEKWNKYRGEPPGFDFVEYFRRLDENHDGFIDKDELLGALRAAREAEENAPVLNAMGVPVLPSLSTPTKGDQKVTNQETTNIALMIRAIQAEVARGDFDRAHLLKGLQTQLSQGQSNPQLKQSPTVPSALTIEPDLPPPSEPSTPVHSIRSPQAGEEVLPPPSAPATPVSASARVRPRMHARVRSEILPPPDEPFPEDEMPPIDEEDDDVPPMVMSPAKSPMSGAPEDDAPPGELSVVAIED